MNRKAQRKPEGIGSILKKVVEEIETKNPDTKEKILNAWLKVSGKKAQEHSRPISLRRKVLTIEVDSSTWIFALNIKKGQLVKNIQKELGKEKIQNIRFRIGEET